MRMSPIIAPLRRGFLFSPTRGLPINFTEAVWLVQSIDKPYPIRPRSGGITHFDRLPSSYVN